MTPEWILKLITYCKHSVPKDFVGSVRVNIFKGGVSNVNVEQSYKEDNANERAH